MNTKLRLTAMLLSASSVIIPPTLYRAAQLYTYVYDRGFETGKEIKQSALSMVGLQEIPTESLDALITNASIEYSLNPRLLAALVHQESRGNSDSYSPKGAIGLAQIMPFNAKRCGLNRVSKLWDDETNISCGAQILSEELKTYKNNTFLALMAYNGGPKCIKNQCSESLQYARAVISRFADSSL